MCSDVVLQLGEDGKPDVFWAEAEVVVRAISIIDAPDQAVLHARDVGVGEVFSGERALEEAFAAAVLVWAGLGEQVVGAAGFETFPGRGIMGGCL